MLPFIQIKIIMKTKLLTGLIILFTIFNLSGQDNRKYWDEGKLTWDDFNEKDYSIEKVSELKYFIGYNTGKEKLKDTTLIRLKTFCYIDKNLSWVNKKYKNAQTLQYNQVIFDIAELYKRKLQYELDRINSVNEAEIRFNKVFSDFNNTVNQFQEETDWGRNTEKIDKWNSFIKQELLDYKKTSIPPFIKRDFGYGAHLGLGSSIFSGSLGEHFGQSFNLIFGFDLAYKKSLLYISGTLGGNKVNKDYFSDKNWHQGQHTNLAIIDLSYAYAIVDNSKLKLAPFAGLGITELTRKNNENENDLRIVDSNVIFGLNTDFKIGKRINLLPSSFTGLKEIVETSIRVRLYVAKANFFDDLNGYSINLSIGLSGFGNLIKLK